MKLRIASIGFGILLTTCRGLAAPEATDTNFFPIMAWNWSPKEPAALLKMREGGLTIAGFAAPDALDACRAAGLKAIVSDARVSDYDWGKVNEAKARNNIVSLVILLHFQDETRCGKVRAWQDHAGLIQSS